MNSFQIAKSYAMTEIAGRGVCFVHGLPPRANSLVSNYKPYKSACHSSEGWNPEKVILLVDWIPAFAGMTNPPEAVLKKLF